MYKYIVATIKEWNINQYQRSLYKKNKNWYLVTNPKKLTFKYIKSINPKYIFFPHWSEKVNSKIINNYECICFHETDLPFGRGGSPIQNLILRNYKKTNITAIKMTDVLDAGPIYLKRSLKLDGNAQQIYERISKKVFKMIRFIVNNKMMPKVQKGKIVKFKRRNPKQSIIPKNISSLKTLYNFVRMLDAETYPKALINYGKLKIEFKNAKMNNNFIDLKASIKLKRTSK